jgi:phosphate transport system substrate-binding protein
MSTPGVPSSAVSTHHLKGRFMNIRRIAAVSTVAVAGALLVSACGASNSSTTAATAATTPTPAATGNPTSPVTLTEDGSSLLYPYLEKLAPALSAAYPNITLTTAAGGSGKGQSDAEEGNVIMGGSDAYLSNGVEAEYPTMLNIPIAVSAQAINYNLPGVSNLKLSGDIIAKIYQGSITKWNDAAIAALNSGVTLPSTTIVPVRRLDSSGDTFIFTSFLSATNSTWSNGPNFGTTVSWPAVSNELTASGNPNMVTTCQSTPGCIAYIGVSVEATAIADGLGEANLQNKAGNFLLPTQANITAAVAAGATNVPKDLRQSLIYEGGASSYPIVNFEYLIINRANGFPAATALAIRTFLSWAIDPNGGATATNLGAVDFVALPNSVVPAVKAGINSIQAS